MKKSILLLAIALIYSQNSFSQLKGWDINGFTPVEEIEVLHDFSEVNDLHKGELIFSKARGAFSISAINAINNRALLKLKTEASMKGASHIFIDYRNIENSVFSKSSMYSATLYKKNKLNLSEVKNKLDGKSLVFNNKTTYNRNKWRTNISLSIIGTNAKVVSDPVEKNGKIMIKLNTVGSGNVDLLGIEHEIIAIENNLLLVLREKKNSIVLYGIEIR